MVRPPDPAYIEFLHAFDPHVRELALAARAAVLAAAPDAGELAYDAYNVVALAFTFSGRFKEAFAHVAAYAEHVNLGFNQGATLPDPDGRLRGTGKAIRHVRLHAETDLVDPSVQALIRAAAAGAARPAARGATQTAVRRTSGRKRRPPPPEG
jgi:hypothetical protein